MNASTSITVDVYVESADLSLIYRELYTLATETCHLPREKADALACWYCATGGHVDLTAGDFNP